MKRTFLMSAALTALTLTAACSETADNQTATTNTQGTEQSGMNHSMAADPNNPFAQAEMQMNERMMAAAGANASETWARKMIEHHRGAVAMSQLLIDQGGDPQMVQMARQTIEKQQREIGELERTVAGGISGGSGEANPFGPVEQQMHQAMMAASGANLSETWARKMIVHHQGAVDMSELLIRQGGGDPEVLAMARRTAQDQRREIAHLEAMLRGEGMPPAATPSPSATPATPAKEKSREAGAPPARQPSATPKATPAPRTTERAPATPRPAPAPTPTPTCAPEHRAAGHC